MLAFSHTIFFIHQWQVLTLALIFYRCFFVFLLLMWDDWIFPSNFCSSLVSIFCWKLCVASVVSYLSQLDRIPFYNYINFPSYKDGHSCKNLTVWLGWVFRGFNFHHIQLNLIQFQIKLFWILCCLIFLYFAKPCSLWSSCDTKSILCWFTLLSLIMSYKFTQQPKKVMVQFPALYVNLKYGQMIRIISC